MLRFKAEEKLIGLEIDYNLEILPRTIDTDANRVKQIIINLISNAIKYTRDGLVMVRGSYQEASRELRIAIEDTGVGMGKAQLAGLFKPFTKV